MDTSGTPQERVIGYTNPTGTNKYVVKYNSSTGMWNALFNDVLVTDSEVVANITTGTAKNSAAGGEALCGVEPFNCTLFTQLATMGSSGVWVNWASHLSYVEDSPYNTQDTNPYFSNRLYAHHHSASCA